MSPAVIIVLAIAAGLLAAALALLPLRRRATPPVAWSVAGAAFVAVGILVGLTVWGATADRQAGSRAADAPVLRLLETIERRHPEAQAEIASIRDAMARNEATLTEARAANLAQRYLPQHVPTTTDAAILRFTREMLVLFEDLRVRDPEACKSLAGAGGSYGTGLNVETLRPALEAIVAVIDASVATPQPPPDRARAQQMLGAVVGDLYATNDPTLLPPELLMQPRAAPADRLCNTMVAFYRKVLELPPQDASLVLRAMINRA